MLKFITGNKNKLKEMSEVLSPIKIKQVNIDIEEIQQLNPKIVINHKLREAFKHHQSNFFIEDTATYYQALDNKLPGTFMKWFLDVLKPEGLYNLAKKLGNTKAEMRTIIAYVKSRKQIYFFEGRVKGNMVPPKHGAGFGLDPVFMPVGSQKTLAELKKDGVPEFSARYRAAIKFKKYLLQNIL